MNSLQWKRLFAVLLLQVGLMGVLVWWTPPEQVLGTSIRWVVLHVSFIWAGLLGLFVSALGGIGVGLHREMRGFTLLQVGAFFSLVFFGLGLLLSMAAAQANWGGVFWQEPRMRVMLSMLFVTTLVQTLNAWLPWKRVRCWMHVVPALSLLLALALTPLVLHPRNPVQSTTSWRFHVVFFSSVVTCIASLCALVWAVASSSSLQYVETSKTSSAQLPA